MSSSMSSVSRHRKRPRSTVADLDRFHYDDASLHKYCDGLGALSSAAGLGIEQLLKGNGLVSSRIFNSPGLGGGGR